MKRFLILLACVLAPVVAVGQPIPSSNVRLPVFLNIYSAVNGTGAFTGQLTGPVGNCTTAPAYSFTGDLNTGTCSPSANVLGFVTDGTQRWQIGATGHLLAVADNSYDIGAAGATRPRSGYFGTTVFTPRIEGNGTTLALSYDSGSRLSLNGTGLVFQGGGAVTSTVSGTLGIDNGQYVVINAAAGYLRVGPNSVIINTAPTVPVACTSPTVTWSNGTAAFQIDVGSTCAGISTLAVTMPASANAWMCTAMNVTTSATAAVEMTASTTTSATFTNYTRTTGAVLAWVDGADVRISCLGG